MPDYICSNCGNSFEAEPDSQGSIVCESCGMVMSAEDSRMALPPGTRIAGYELIRHIAAGSSGSVYQAEQIAMERTVALKILNPERLDRNSAKRFLEEARNTAKFENPHVVAILDSGISPEGYYYIAMQYVEGESLEDMLRRGRAFPEDEALMIAITVADALRAIWNKYKMFHKDIKPANIMLTPENEPMILDMGAAQEGGESKLADGDIEGSPYYMSPEQARGEELTWSTDLYSLGATLYQMITGQYPYEAPTVEEILRMHDSAPFPDPAERAPGIQVSEKMTALLRRMMGKTPADRYNSWEDFIQEARLLLNAIWKKKGSSVPKRLRRQYQAQDPNFAKPVLKLRKPPPFDRILLLGLIIFILAGALLGGVFLYLTVQHNSANARFLLPSIRQRADELLETADPDAVDELIRKTEPYFHRLGVLPSVRRELAVCRKMVEDFRELMRQEEIGITRLESEVADSLKAADEEIHRATTIASSNTPELAGREFEKARNRLRIMTKTVRERTFVLKSNINRKQQLTQRLAAALRTVQREQMDFEREIKRKQAAARRAMQREKIAAEKNQAESAKREKPLPPPNPLLLEKERIRTTLLLREPPWKTGPENPLWQLSIPPGRERSKQQEDFEQWVKQMQRLTAAADRFWLTLFNSRRLFAGFEFTVTLPDGSRLRMKLWTIHRAVALLSNGQRNEQRPFTALDRNEWLDFLDYAARKKNLRHEQECFLLLSGCFDRVKNSQDLFIRQEIPYFAWTMERLNSSGRLPARNQKMEGSNPPEKRPLRPRLKESYNPPSKKGGL